LEWAVKEPRTFGHLKRVGKWLGIMYGRALGGDAALRIWGIKFLEAFLINHVFG